MKYPYEVLIRLHRDGIVGAHVVFAADMENPLSGEVQTTIGNAESLSVADGQAGLSLADVLGEAAATALVTAERAQAELAAVKARLSAAQAELVKLKAVQNPEEAV